MKKTFLLVATLFAMLIGAQASSTTVTVPKISEVGIIVPVSGTSYYLYDVSKDMFLNNGGQYGGGNLAASPSVTITPNATSPYYTFTSSVNASNYLKSGRAGSSNLWWDDAAPTTDAVAQWYITSSANGCTLDVGQTVSGNTAGALTRSESQKMYLFYNASSALDFTTDATVANEFLFITPDDYSKYVAKAKLAKVINVAASANYDNADAVTTFNNSSATTSDYTTAANTLLTNVLANCTNVDVTSLYLSNNDFSTGTANGWTNITATVAINEQIATCTTTGNFWLYYKGITLPAGIYTFSMDALDDNASAQVYISQSATGNTVKVTNNVTAGQQTDNLVNSAVIISVENESAVDMGMQRMGSTGQWVKMDNAKLVYNGPATPQTITDENTTNNIETRVAGGTITITRSLTADKYNAIVLPIDLTADEISTLFGSGATVATMISASDDGVVSFTTVTKTTAGVPFLVKPSTSGINSVQLTNKVVKPTITPTTNNGITFTGTYNTISGNDAVGLYFLSGNVIYKGTTVSTIKPMRGYFTTTTTNPAASLSFQINGDGVVTKIDHIDGIDAVAGNDAVFNVAGQRINANHLTKGIYVKKGKKLIVR
jgi:hypothetical protein